MDEGVGMGEGNGTMTELDCICSATRDAARKLTALYDRHLAPSGVSIAQYRLITSIDPASGASLTDLARKLDMDRSTIGRNVRVVEKLGLVRQGAGSDARESVVAITEEGKAAIKVARPLWEAAQTEVRARIGAVASTAFTSILATLG